ncbi:MAG: hypothetical protein UHG91_01895 [Succinivibrionaceae bacterium]|nr:hypothetical protein [Ruminobacter sp.]MEE1339518.1 hypothetical protein [Succinivibrionaceae bacterium]
MEYSNHALNRMEQRSFSKTMIDECLDLFYKYGSWNSKGDRVTLETGDNNFHEIIDSQRKTLSEQKKLLANCTKEEISKIKNIVKKLKKSLRIFEKLEHKKSVTLIIEDDVIVTVFRQTKRIPRDKKIYKKVF